MAEEFGPKAREWILGNAHQYEDADEVQKINKIERGLCDYMMRQDGRTDDDLIGIIGPLRPFIQSALQNNNLIW